MKDNYAQSIAFVFKYEGGYVNNPKDPGGPTSRGITLATARSFWKSDATAEDIKNMPKAVAESIYRKQYADKINFDSIPSGIDLCALDASVMSGPSRANTWLKKAKTIEEYQALRLNFYKSLPIWSTFGKGWTTRVNSCSILANTLYSNNSNTKSTSRLEDTINNSTKTNSVLKASKESRVHMDGWVEPTNKPNGVPNVSNTISNIDTNSNIKTNSSVSLPGPKAKTAGGLIAIGGTLAMALSDYWPYILGATGIVMVASYILTKYFQWRHGQAK